MDTPQKAEPSAASVEIREEWAQKPATSGPHTLPAEGRTAESDADSVAKLNWKGLKEYHRAQTRDIKVMIENALADSGGEGYLRQQAMDNPTAFMALVGKLIPKDMTVKHEITAHVRHELVEQAVALILGRDPQPRELPAPEHKSANY